MAVVKIAIPEVLPPVEESIVEIPTTRFGALTIPATEIYEMGEGMHGFPELRRFLLLAPDPPGGLFYWWQAVDEPAIAFPCCDPGKIFPDTASIPMRPMCFAFGWPTGEACRSWWW